MSKLVVIGVPIGNLKDISLRALDWLGTVNTLVCEDTRVTGKLLHLYQEKGWLKKMPRRLISFNEFNARSRLEEVKQVILNQEVTGLVSDAGMPLVSDPGFRLVRFCYDQGIEVEVVPGPSAVTMAMVMSGIGGGRYLFVGFLPKKPGKREKELELIGKIWELDERVQVVMFVSPHRVRKVVRAAVEVLGDQVRAVLLREMTKKFESRWEGSLAKLAEKVEQERMKGEMVLVLARGTV